MYSKCGTTKPLFKIEGLKDESFLAANGCTCVVERSKTVYGVFDTEYEVVDVKIVEVPNQELDYLVGVVVEVFPSNLTARSNGPASEE